MHTWNISRSVHPKRRSSIDWASLDNSKGIEHGSAISNRANDGLRPVDAYGDHLP